MSFTEKELLDIYDHLKKFAFRLTKNTENGEDLLSETIIKMLENEHQFSPDLGELFSWGSRIMFTTFASNYKRARRRDTQYDPEQFVLTLRSADDPEQSLQIKETVEALNALPEHQREVLEMVALGDKYHEVAAKLNVPIGTIRSRVMRGRDTLRNRDVPCFPRRR